MRSIAAAAAAGLVFAAACAGASTHRGGAKAKSRVVEAPPPRHEPAPLVGIRLPDTVAPVHYALELALDPAEPRFHGTVDIEVRISVPVDAVWIDAQGLELDGVSLTTAANAKAPAEQVIEAAPPDGEGRVALTRPDGGMIAAGDAVIHVEYRGAVGDETTGLFAREVAGRAYLFTQLESIFARQLVPCFDEPRWKTPWDLTLVVPDGQVALTDTPEVARTPRAGGRVAVRFATTPPLPSYLIAVAVGPFELVDAGAVGRGKVPARLVVPAGRAADAATIAAVIAPVVDALERYVDQPLPVAKLDLVAVPNFFGGMENPGLVTIADNLALTSGAADAHAVRQNVVGLLGHELAHLWFGDLVTMAWWDDLWLSESFATWMSGKVVAAVNPHADVIADARDQIDRAMSFDGGIAVRHAIERTADIERAFDTISYAKGAALIAMIEHAVGAEPFRRALQAYLRDHAGTAVGGAELEAAVAAIDPDAGAALSALIDSQGVPDVELALSCVAGAPARVAVQVTWSGRSAALPVCVRFPDTGGAAGEHCAWVAGAGAIELGDRCPAWLAGNAGGVGYYRVVPRAALLDPLRAALRQVGVAERLAIVSDLDVGHRGLQIDGPALLLWIDALLAVGDQHDLAAAVRLARAVGRDLDPAEPRWRPWVEKRFAGRAHAAGIAAHGDESEARATARRALIELAGVDGADATVRRDARRRLDAWLDGTDPLDPADRRVLLAIAVPAADTALFDRLVTTAADPSTPAAVRIDVLSALGSVEAPALVERDFELFARGTFDPTESLQLLIGPLTSPRAGDRAWQILRRDHDLLRGRDPELDSHLLGGVSTMCDAARKADVEALFAPDEARTFVEISIDACVALHASPAASALRAALKP